MMTASSAASSASKSSPRKFLSPIKDQHLPGRSLTAGDERHAHELLVDLWGALGVPSNAKMACRRNPQKKREWLAQ
jgi:hypothetical protein